MCSALSMGVIACRDRAVGSRHSSEHGPFDVAQASSASRYLRSHPMKSDNPVPKIWARWCACRQLGPGRYGMALCNVDNSSTFYLRMVYAGLHKDVAQ